VVPLKEGLALYNDIFQNGWNEMMSGKLGFTGFKPESDNKLIGELTAILPLVETDMTIFFRNLAQINIHPEQQDRTAIPAPLTDAYYRPEQLTEEYKNRIGSWLESYRQRSRQENLSAEARRRKMNRVNPKYVLRNYMAQLAIDEAEKGSSAVIDELLELVRHPYDEQPENEKYAARRPDWARNRPGCSMLSCSS